MKTLKFLLLAAMLGIYGSMMAQSAKPSDKSEGLSTYFVQMPHTHEQCMTALVEMKDKGDKLLSEFEYGCMSGDHTAYGFLEGSSEESIRNMLPASEKKTAKINKVNKFSAAEIEKMHKDHM